MNSHVAPAANPPTISPRVIANSQRRRRAFNSAPASGADAPRFGEGPSAATEWNEETTGKRGSVRAPASGLGVPASVCCGSETDIVESPRPNQTLLATRGGSRRTPSPFMLFQRPAGVDGHDFHGTAPA